MTIAIIDMASSPAENFTNVVFQNDTVCPLETVPNDENELKVIDDLEEKRFSWSKQEQGPGLTLGSERFTALGGNFAR